MSAALDEMRERAEIEEHAARRERAEILALLESLKLEWRPQPGGCACGSCGQYQRRLNEPVLAKDSGLVIHPSSLASPLEVWVLDRAIAKIRARK